MGKLKDKSIEVGLKIDPEKDNAYFNKKNGRKKKFESQNYSNSDATEKLIEYCLDEKKMLHNMFRCYGAPNTTDYNTVAAAFNCIRKLKNQNHDRLMNHFVIPLNEKATQEFGLDGLKEITEAYIEPIAKDFQLVYAIHEDKGKTLHSHIAFNHTSYTTGLRHRRPKGFINQELDRLQAIVNQIREKKST